MKHVLAGALAVFAVAVLSGCDWEGVDSDGGVVQRYNWVRFDGVYSSAPNRYLVEDFDTGNSNTTSSAGSSGAPIYSMTVQQAGNNLTLLDNNGRTYSGLISTIASSGGQTIEYPDTTTSMPANGDTMTASFEVFGRSSSGVQVTIVGTFTGVATVTAATATTPSTIRLATRTIRGTWIEANGATGEVLGTAP